MEFESLEQHELVISILQQIKKAILDLQEWNNDVVSIDGYYNNSSGMQKLSASCMLLEAIGEGFKKIDSITNQKLLIEYDSIPWKEIMGMRNHIAHGYFDIDAELVLYTIKNDLSSLLNAVEFFLKKH